MLYCGMISVYRGDDVIMRKCVIIMNPESGKKKKLKNYNIFYDTLRKYGYETEIIFTKRKGHAIEIVKGNFDCNFERLIISEINVVEI